MNLLVGDQTVAAFGEYVAVAWFGVRKRKALKVGTSATGVMGELMQLIMMQTLTEFGEDEARARMVDGEKLVIRVKFFLRGFTPQTAVDAYWSRSDV